MRRCPKCNRTYTTDTQKFCTHDGGILVTVESPQADTIRIDSAQLDAPTRAISRELVPEAEKFDPYKTTIGQRPPASGGAPEPRARITQDLTPVEPPPPEATAPLPPSDSGTLRSLPPTQSQPPADSGPIATSSPLPAPPAQAPPPSQDAFTKTIASAPLPAPPTPSPQFPSAAQAQQVKPLAAAGPKRKSKLVLILGILAVLLVLGVGVLGAAYIFWLRPMLAARRVVVVPTESPRPQTPTEPTPIVATTPTNTETPGATPQDEPPPYSPPSDAVEFANSSKNLNGKLADHYVDFSFYYPERWEKDPKAGVPGATNFAGVERRLPPDFTQESFAVGWYSSSGSAADDKALFPNLAANLSTQFAKNFPDYRKVSEGETKAGVYDGYEFRFESTSRNTAKGDIKVWGRVIFIPPADGGKNGVTLLMLATSLAPELKSIDDVGAKGELPMILESFRFGKK
jgi:hypothetical protein